MTTTKATRAFIPLLLILLVPRPTDALGLGEIKTESYLNEPLNARISVLSSRPGELEQARIGLAPAAVSIKAGADPRTAPETVAFKLEKDPGGKPFIRVTSRKSIKEPALDFVVQVVWSRASVSREYAVLLDPPPLPPQSFVAVRAPASAVERAGTPAVARVSAYSMDPPPGVPTRPIEPKLTAHRYGPTMRPNVLWDISGLIRPSKAVSIPQVMLAVVKKNPEAFYDHNVNELKAGYVLLIPDLSSMEEVNAGDAQREVSMQRQRWLHRGIPIH